MMKRRGYSLIELVVSLIAATALVSTLAATIVITTELTEVPPDDKVRWHDRAITDRLAADLRYATDVDETYSNGFQIAKADPSTGNSQTVSYQSYLNGLTRQVDGGSVVPLDSEAPSHAFQVDGYSAPTITPSSNVVRLRSSSTAASLALSASIDINLPPGCKPGDLLLLAVSAKTPSSITVSQAGWQTLSVQAIDDLRLVTVHRSYNATLPNTFTISVTPPAAVAAAMVALENVDPASPIHWNSTDAGYAWSFLPGTHANPLEAAGFSAGQLNVQVFAANRDPWHSGTMGMASFTDAARATAAAGVSLIENSIGIVVRNGPTPSLTSTPRLWHQTSGYWLQTGVRVGVLP